MGFKLLLQFFFLLFLGLFKREKETMWKFSTAHCVIHFVVLPIAQRTLKTFSICIFRGGPLAWLHQSGAGRDLGCWLSSDYFWPVDQSQTPPGMILLEGTQSMPQKMGNILLDDSWVGREQFFFAVCAKEPRAVAPLEHSMLSSDDLWWWNFSQRVWTNTSVPSHPVLHFPTFLSSCFVIHIKQGARISCKHPE